MGTRHMRALETATREEVVAAITLSGEDGRITIFTDEGFEDYQRTMGEEDESVTN
jgi:DNA integrity scanning protein DisA with diadenylate cyclase activity